MASALRQALLKNREPSDLFVYDPSGEVQEEWASKLCGVCESEEELLQKADWLVLAVKPQSFYSLRESLAKLQPPARGLLSVMAGVNLDSLESMWSGLPAVRSMPNTPLLLGEGVVALTAGRHAGDDILAEAEAFFKPVARTEIVREEQMDGVTAISGSGPAYFFYLAEQVQAVARELSLEPELALRLFAGTLSGAAKMMEQSGKSPSELRTQVTSPGGTTEAALKSFDSSDFGRSFATGLKKAHQRSIELSKV